MNEIEKENPLHSSLEALAECTENWANAITSYRTTLIKKIKENRKKVHERDWDQANLDEGYNKALDDIFTLIQDTESKK